MDVGEGKSEGRMAARAHSSDLHLDEPWCHTLGAKIPGWVAKQRSGFRHPELPR